MSFELVDLRHGAIGFDCYEPMSAVQYKSMGDLGFSFTCRYLDNLTDKEIDDLLASGLSLVPVQVARKSGWSPTSTTGSEDGARARQDAIRLGLPMGLNLFRDLETPNELSTVVDIHADARSWCAEVRSGGYEPKVYVGAGLLSILTPQDLYKLPYVGYWSSFSQVPSVATRGYQLRQLFHYPEGQCRVREVFPNAPPEVADVLIDFDVASFDYKGSRVAGVVY